MSKYKQSQQGCGVVLSTAGRSVQLLDGDILWAKTASRAIRPIVGDRVRYELKPADSLITALEKRRNCLMRTFGQEDREIAANLDQLFLVSAAPPLFNTIAIDRVCSVAHAQGIGCTVLHNKIDLGTAGELHAYSAAGINVLKTSAKQSDGIEELRSLLQNPAWQVAAFCGVSGVGKSSLLQCLMPGLDLRTAEVSIRTGQGRQTTSQAAGYLFERGNLPPLVLIDLPGSHQFGVAHLSRREIENSFAEFSAFRLNCEYSDCFHIAEPHCGIKTALADGKIAPSRYLSYTSMIAEIDQMPDSRKYRRSDD